MNNFGAPFLPTGIMTTVYLVEKSSELQPNGIYADTTVRITPFQGAVLPLTNTELTYDQGGTYTAQDRKIYTYKQLAGGQTVEHKGNMYTVMEKRDYEHFDNQMQIYFIKKVDAVSV